MKRLCFVFVGLLALTGCERANDTYVCDKYTVHIALDESGEKLTADFNGDTVEMNIVPSASGARYVANLNDTEISLWNKGNEWTLFVDDQEPIRCK